MEVEAKAEDVEAVLTIGLSRLSWDLLFGPELKEHSEEMSSKRRLSKRKINRYLGQNWDIF